MKNSETVTLQPNLTKKQSEKQLRQLFQSYCFHIGNDLLPILSSAFFDQKNYSKEVTQLHTKKMKEGKQKIYWGCAIIVSTLTVLLCTMIGLFQFRTVLIFGIFWGFVVTKNAVKLQRDLLEILMFWMIFGLILALQNILKVGLFFMPFYHSLKLFLIISLLYPRIDLKNKIYKNYFLPRLASLSQNLKLQK